MIVICQEAEKSGLQPHNNLPWWVGAHSGAVQAAHWKMKPEADWELWCISDSSLCIHTSTTTSTDKYEVFIMQSLTAQLLLTLLTNKLQHSKVTLVLNEMVCRCFNTLKFMYVHLVSWVLKIILLGLLT